ncbi:hypothetical protein D1164_13065 [Mariniphaga sediminis]|uniref:Uncharacterized protein n=2 Tax=Mariniphaga sediminis TaxID=1628158 RepID=A0A399D3H5_9BACT|nr:hypothetical protein D1164_13065 [Mariniphaga sediminis]
MIICFYCLTPICFWSENQPFEPICQVLAKDKKNVLFPLDGRKEGSVIFHIVLTWTFAEDQFIMRHQPEIISRFCVICIEQSNPSDLGQEVVGNGFFWKLIISQAKSRRKHKLSV